MNRLTVKDSIIKWTTQLKQFLDRVAVVAKADGWSESFSETPRSEQPPGLGANIDYNAPILVLTRASANGEELRVTFEPRYRFTIGAAGRIDIYSYPAFREAMLLRTPNTNGAETLTWDEAEERVTEAPWKAFSTERLPLQVDFASDLSIQGFLKDLVS